MGRIRSSMVIGDSRRRLQFQPIDAVAAGSPDGELLWSSRQAGEGRLCVLVADDDVNAAASLATLVRSWGHDVWVASQGAVALELAAAFQTDVVLADIVMPHVDGCQVARRLRRQARFEDTLLLALLGQADGAERRRAEKAGFDLCLVKPVEPQTLEVLLGLEQEWLAQRSAAVRQLARATTARKAGSGGRACGERPCRLAWPHNGSPAAHETRRTVGAMSGTTQEDSP